MFVNLYSVELHQPETALALFISNLEIKNCPEPIHDSKFTEFNVNYLSQIKEKIDHCSLFIISEGKLYFPKIWFVRRKIFGSLFSVGGSIELEELPLTLEKN